MRRFIPLAMGVMLATAAVAPASPQPVHPLAVTPQVGPWMILVTSYRGDDARIKAEEMCQELRSMKVPAYLFNRAEQEQRKEAERIAALREEHKKRLRAAGLDDSMPIRIKTVRIEDQYAVLVGGFKDDSAARAYLPEVRKIKVSEKLQLVACLPDASGKVRQTAISPFQTAFICRNPTVQAEKAANDNTPDPRLKEYNSGESYSLLKCPQPWTMVVKSYAGATVVQSQNTPKSLMEKLASFGRGGALLNANARQAHEVAEFLRKFGLEAYVLHTEYTSYVTVGGFSGPDDPKFTQMQQAFVGEMNNIRSNVGQLHTVGGVQFFPQPMPMAVPQVK